MARQLYLSDTNKIISGLCGGLGEYFDIDPTLVRIVAVILFFASASTLLLGYVLAWIIVPRRDPLTTEDSSEPQPTVAPPPGEKRNSSMARYLPGLILVLIGALLLMREYVWWFGITHVWALGLIVIGAAMIVYYASRSVGNRSSSHADDQNGFGGGMAK